MSEFGSRFKTARELQGITFEQIAQKTRISSRFLRAIEGEAFDELPGGLFSRGFVRTYAEAVGLDPDQMVEEYLALNADAAPPQMPKVEIAPPPAGDSRREKYVLPAAIGGLFVLVFVLYLGTRGGEAVRPADAAIAAASMPEPVAPEAPAPGPPDGNEDPDAGLETEATDEEAEGARLQVSANEPEADQTAASRDPGEAIVLPTTEAAPAAEASLQPPVGNRDPVVVRVEVHDPTWIYYVALDGQVMYEEITINPPFWRNYTVNEALELRIGNPSGVSVSVNGQPVSSPAAPDETWTATITPENASQLTGSL